MGSEGLSDYTPSSDDLITEGGGGNAPDPLTFDERPIEGRSTGPRRQTHEGRRHKTGTREAQGKRERRTREAPEAPETRGPKVTPGRCPERWSPR
ncbi:hypothetical protein GCM10009548_31870 [Streptomyces malaysiensis subsp. malaysiensis]